MNRFRAVRTGLARHALFPVLAAVTRRQALRELATLRALERADPEIHRSRQEQRLRVLVGWAYDTVPYYRRVMADAGLSPRDVQCAEDLTALPILRRGDIRESLADLVSTRTSARDLYVRQTSGTIGMPLRVYRDRRTLPMEPAWMWQAFEWANLTPAEPMLLAMPATIQDGHGRISRITLWHRFCGGGVLPLEALFAQQIGPVVETLEAVDPAVIYGYPSLLHLLAQVILRSGRPPRSRLRCIFYHAEQLGEDTRDLLERAFGVPIFSRYGAREFSAVVAQTCQYGRWHVNTEGCIIEIVDGAPGDRHGRPAAAGRLVITDLRNHVLPLIRYEVGDLAITATDRPCPCGRTLPLLGGLQGRATEFVVTASGHRIPLTLLYRPMRTQQDRLYEYQFRQRRPGELEVLLVPTGSYGAEDGKHLVRHLENFLGTDVAVTVTPVDRIARDASGKRPVLKSELEQSLPELPLRSR